MRSRNNIKIFDFNGVNVGKHCHVAGQGICHLWLPCFISFLFIFLVCVGICPVSNIGLIIFILLTNRASPILRFQAGSAITMECICVHKSIYSDYLFYRCILHKYIQLNRVVSWINVWTWLNNLSLSLTLSFKYYATKNCKGDFKFFQNIHEDRILFESYSLGVFWMITVYKIYWLWLVWSFNEIYLLRYDFLDRSLADLRRFRI